MVVEEVSSYSLQSEEVGDRGQESGREILKDGILTGIRLLHVGPPGPRPRGVQVVNINGLRSVSWSGSLEESLTDYLGDPDLMGLLPGRERPTKDDFRWGLGRADWRSRKIPNRRGRRRPEGASVFLTPQGSFPKVFLREPR